MIGDKYSDIYAESSNCRTIMIESGKQDKMIRGVKPDFIVKDL